MKQKAKEKKKRNMIITEVKNDEMFRRIQKSKRIITAWYGDQYQYEIIPAIFDQALLDFIKRNKEDMVI